LDAVSELLIIFTCLVCSAFFSGSETALLRLGRDQIDQDIDGEHGLPALAARDLVANTGNLLVTILLGNNIVNILAAAVASTLAVRALGEQRGLVVSTVALTLVVLVFCEILPKAIAARNPRRASYTVALPLYLIHRLLKPVHWGFTRFIDPVVRRISGAEEGGASRADDLLELARKMTAQTPSASPVGILGSTAQAVERRVAEVMTPRTEIYSADAKTPVSELLDLMLEQRYTRVPLWTESIDNIEGFVHFKELTGLVRSGGTDLGEIMHSVLRVPERKPILELLADMQREAVNIALVKDEYGITVGLITQEDILEELVGELRDEFDHEELEEVRSVSDGVYEAAGGVTVLDFNRKSGWTVPGRKGQSLGGVAFSALGRAPKTGDQVVVDGYTLSVLKVAGTHIQQVRVESGDSPEE